MARILFANQVAIVTGAAGGIGFAIAEALARRGANILLNDYGGDTYGKSGSSDRAEEAASKLRSLGAEVVACGIPVGTAESARGIVAAAISAFGRVDILVNNAGVSLPGLITDFSDADVENHFRINLTGAYFLVRAVWPHMRDQGYGRILSTSSNSAFGIGCNAPYSTTKAGLIGLTLDAAQEGRDQGILVNAMMPVAYSRMTDQIPDEEFVDWFRTNMPAEKVARAVLYLLSSASQVSGRIFSAGGGRMARVAFAIGRGWLDREITPESVAGHLDDIDDMSEALIIDSQPDELSLYLQPFPFASGRHSLALDPEAVKGASSGKID